MPASGKQRRGDASKPLRGEDAWLAAKADIARRNDEARTRLAEENAPHTARRVARRLEAERLQAGDLPPR
jgi:hypothetical protein